MEFRTATAEQLMDYVVRICCDAGCVCNCGADGSPVADDYAWGFLPAFDLTALADTETDWVEFWTSQKAYRKKQGRDTQGMEDWWAKDKDSREQEPLILVLDPAGKACIWDGCHRVGISTCHGIRYVPVVLGTPRAATT